MKFLIIRFSSIGDIVLTTPVIRCLRKKYPGARIDYLTKSSFGPVLKANPYIDNIIYLSDDITDTLNTLQATNYDHIIDLHHSLRSLRIKRKLRKVPAHAFNKLNLQKWIFTNFKVNLMPHKHIVDRYLDTVSGLGVVNDGAGLDYFIPEEEEVKPADIPFSHSHGFIAIAIGAAHATKKLPVAKLEELVAQIEYPIILLGGKEDRENGKLITESDPVKIYNACGKFSLNESADLVRRSTMVISHDTGLMHIAAAFKKRVFSVWGNTVPSFGMTPYQTVFEVFQVNKLWCRPCSKIGYSKCPLGHFKCMYQQDIGAMSAGVHAFVKK